MGTRAVLFSDPQLNNRIRTLASVLKDINNNPSDEDRFRFRLGTVLEIIFQNSHDFDDRCQFNIKHIGNGFASTIINLGANLDSAELLRLNSILFRFVCEYDISVANSLSLELTSFIDGVLSEYENYKTDFKNQIDYARYKMPTAIIKDILNSEDFLSLRNVQGIAQSTNDKIDTWKKEIDLSEKRVNDLQDILKNQRDSFNFVGLSKGFSDLEDTTKNELDMLQGRLFVFGFLALIPILLEFLSISLGWINIATANPISLVANAVVSVTGTFILLYFFRIVLRSADACRAQLVQIRLRMTLCRFIQNYADYSIEIKNKNSEALSKFENLIFSGIVSTDDKLPSTFDGIEQLSGLLKSIRGDGK